MTTRICPACGKQLPYTPEYFHRRGGDKLRGKCKQCRSAKRRGTKIQIDEVVPLKKIEKATTYLVTYAQNATPVDEGFFRAMQAYAAHNNAKIVVIAGRYRNPTSFWSQAASHDDWWTDAIVPYVFDGVHNISPHVAIFGDVSIQPTAIRPLSGFESYVEHQSGVFGHPKQELKVIPTSKRAWPRLLISTGACTVENYTDSKAGKKGERGHTIGAAVIEVSGKKFHPRLVAARDDGSFQDLNKLYTPDGVVEDQEIEALVCGDLHVAYRCNLTEAATFFDDDSIVNTLKPKSIVYHDILSMRARPKYGDNLRTRYENHYGEHDSVEAELTATIEYVDGATPEYANGYVVASNHDDHLLHWLDNARVSADPKNALIYHKLWCLLLEDYHARGDGEFSPVMKLWHDRVVGGDKIKFLQRDETLTIGGHVCSFHGHRGANGTRGAIGQFAKLGVKSVVGHSHSPGIQDRCVQVGVTGDLDMGYNSLPSSWFHAHALLYPDGTRTLIFVIDGEWRA